MKSAVYFMAVSVHQPEVAGSQLTQGLRVVSVR